MNRLGLKSLIPLALAGVAVLVLGAATARAQAAAPADQGQRTDGQIESDVVHELDASSTLKNDLITAATIQSEVTLSGTVSSQASKDLAGSITQGVPGVTKVHNNLLIGDPQQAAKEENLPQDDDVAVDQPQAQAPTAQPQPQSQAPTAQAQPQAAPNAYPQRPQYGIPNGSPTQPQNAQQYPPQSAGQQAQYPAPAPGYAPPPNYARQPGYAQQPAYAPPTGPVTIAPGTLIELRTDEAITSKRAQNGAPVEFTVIKDVIAGGGLAIPRGAIMRGVIAEVKQVGHGDLGGSAKLALRLTSLELGGQSYPVESDLFRVQGPNKGGETVGSALAGGLIGTIIGCAAGRGAGCAVGAGAGVAAGTAASAASSGPQAWIPAEARVDFHLAAPLTVYPVSAQEAARLAQGLYQGGPSLYQRPGPYYGPRYYAPGYPYYPVYFRPYILVGGGVHYWR